MPKQDRAHPGRPPSSHPYSHRSPMAGIDRYTPENDPVKPVLASQVIPAIKEIKPRHQAIEEQSTDKRGVARNRRMLGMILGTLQKFQSEESRRKPVTQKRAEIEEKLDKQAEEERASIRKERRELAKKKREEQAQLRKTELKEERVTIHDEWEKSHKNLINFIQTKTKPPIFYLPTKPTPESEKRCKETKEKFRWILAEKRAKVQKELADIEDLYKKDDLDEESTEGNKDSSDNIVNKEESENGKIEPMDHQGDNDENSGEMEENREDSSILEIENRVDDGEILSDEEKDNNCSLKMNQMNDGEEEEDGEEPVIDPRLCAICQENGPKYKCPCCSLRTCSASCVQAHKTVYNCSGRAAPATFKKLSNIAEADLRHDYFFLNDGDRFLGSLRRERINIVRSADELPSWLKKLIYEAKMRGTRLRILPAGFKKRCENKTAYQYSLKEIHWDIELEFTHIMKRGESIQQTSSVILHRVPENRTLMEVVQEYIDPQDIINKNEIWKNYRVYREIGTQNWVTKIRLAKTTLIIDPSQQIRSILSGRTIIEYPTFIITLAENTPESIVEKDSNEEMNIDEENVSNDHPSSI
ncbi:uncharacterized protein LOC141853501 [Brevipalpus obovatus]|uniref:uncharacterized protein LOC141853501 n=1 Tax=Brevipalpus obovatus TaxID=246614 RepID=UPI003D9E1196